MKLGVYTIYSTDPLYGGGIFPCQTAQLLKRGNYLKLSTYPDTTNTKC